MEDTIKEENERYLTKGRGSSNSDKNRDDHRVGNDHLGGDSVGANY